MFEVIELMQTLAAEIVNIDLVGRFFRTIFYRNCEYSLALGQAKSDYLHLFTLFLHFSSVNTESLTGL